MNVLQLLKVMAKYQQFKDRVKYYVELAAKFAELLNDDKARGLVKEMQDFYNKLP